MSKLPGLEEILRLFEKMPFTLVKKEGEPDCLVYSETFGRSHACLECLVPDCLMEDMTIHMFSFKAFNMFTGPEEPSYYKSYRTLDKMMEDGWVID